SWAAGGSGSGRQRPNGSNPAARSPLRSIGTGKNGRPRVVGEVLAPPAPSSSPWRICGGGSLKRDLGFPSEAVGRGGDQLPRVILRLLLDPGPPRRPPQLSARPQH